MPGIAAAQGIWLVVAIVAVVLALLLLVVFFSFAGLYLRALLAGAHVSISEIIETKLIGLNPGQIVNCRIMAMKGGVPIETSHLQAQALAGGHVDRVVRALLIAKHKGMAMTVSEACSIDLVERDPASIANLYGQTAVALEALDPDGRIQVGGEVYKATLPKPEDAESLGVSLPEGEEGEEYFVEEGESVRIVQYWLGLDGFCVEPWQEADARSQVRGTAQGGAEAAEAGG